MRDPSILLERRETGGSWSVNRFGSNRTQGQGDRLREQGQEELPGGTYVLPHG